MTDAFSKTTNFGYPEAHGFDSCLDFSQFFGFHISSVDVLPSTFSGFCHSSLLALALVALQFLKPLFINEDAAFTHKGAVFGD